LAFLRPNFSAPSEIDDLQQTIQNYNNNFRNLKIFDERIKIIDERIKIIDERIKIIDERKKKN